MKEFINKLISRLEELQQCQIEKYTKSLDEGNLACIYDKTDIEDTKVSTVWKALDIVTELAEEYKLFGNSEQVKGGWTACSERLPQTNDAVNITWINRKPEPYYEDIKGKPFTATGHYHNGKWYWFSGVCKDYLDEYGDSEFDRIDKDIEIVAWCELPAPYTEGE